MDRLVTTTYLEMTSPSQAAPFAGERRLEVRRAEIACPEVSRFFYAAVGADWWWYSRLVWTREQWVAWVDRPELETWVAYLSGTPAGYFEMERQQEGREVELVHFGLLPSFVGRGLGQEMLATAVETAWQPGPRRVWLHTCDLDHPRALPNYQAQGFVTYKTEQGIERLPDDPAPLWPASPSSSG